MCCWYSETCKVYWKVKRNNVQKRNIKYYHFYVPVKYVYIVFTQTHIYLYIHPSMLTLGKKMLVAFLELVNNSYIWKEELWVQDEGRLVFHCICLLNFFLPCACVFPFEKNNTQTSKDIFLKLCIFTWSISWIRNKILLNYILDLEFSLDTRTRKMKIQ